VSIEGKIICYNVGQKFIRLDLYREIFGEITEAGKANPIAIGSPSPTGFNETLSWKLSLDKGQKKELIYKYEALIPAADQ
jgi:hypothetical protein